MKSRHQGASDVTCFPQKAVSISYEQWVCFETRSFSALLGVVSNESMGVVNAKD